MTPGETMRVRLLGPVEIEVDGAPLGVGGPRAQAVLALLAVRADEVVTADWLIDQLWGERPPRAARVSLQAYVSRLRAVCAPQSEHLLPHHPRGYLFDATMAEIDAHRFQQLSEQGRAATADGRWPDALHSVRSAGTLWRGVPFTGIDDVPALATERERLAELRVENRLTELQALLEVAGPSDVIGPLRELVDAHRWDERGWRLLMLALYRAGRQTEALEAAARARRLLVDEQGLEPSPALAQLEHKILVHDPALEQARPRQIQIPGWLRAPTTPPIGREAELAELMAQWAAISHDHRSRLVLLEGEPGVGKSHLVTQLAREVGARGGVVLAGRCFDEPRLPLQPWSSMVPDVLPRGPDSAPGQTESQSMIDVWEVAAHRLFVAVLEHVFVALESGPTLMVAEDVHWAGVAALRLLEHVLTSCADHSLLVVATVRSTAGGMSLAVEGALGELAARMWAHTVRLGGLHATDLAELLAGHGHRVSLAEADSVRERTGGVPLLAIEAVRGGQGVLAARVGQVSDAAAQLADLLAVAGDFQPLAMLGGASDLNESALSHAVGELIAVGLVRPAAGEVITCWFTHGLYREALEARLSDLRRVALSRQLLVASDSIPNQILPSALARHAVMVSRSGLPGDIGRAYQECQRAAHWSTRCHEHTEAARWLHDAIDLGGRAGTDDTSIAELHAAYGLACRRAGLPQAREAFLRAAAIARATADHALLARIGVAWSRGFFSRVGEVDTDFISVLREALMAPGQLSAALRAQAMAALAAELTWATDGDERFGLADAALDTARSTNHPATLAYVLRTRHLTMAAADTLAVRRRDTTELLELASRLDDMGLRSRHGFTAPARPSRTATSR